jgi:two-component system sensor kinase FixL
MLVPHDRFHKLWRSAAPVLFGTTGLALLTFICFRLQVGLAAAALLYIMLVVLVSLKGSFISSTVVSVLAIGCLDYFFTTPLFTLGKNDLPNYVAIIVFFGSLFGRHPLSIHCAKTGGRSAFQRELQGD